MSSGDYGSRLPRAVGSYTMIDPAVAGTNIIAQQAANFDVGAGFTQPEYSRCVQVDASGVWDGGNIEVTGVTQYNETVVETIVPVLGGTQQGVYAFATITRLRNLGNRTAGTVDIRHGTKFGLPVQYGKLRAVVKVTRAALDDPGPVVSTVYGTIIPNTAPNGAADYEVIFEEYLTRVV